MVTQRHLPGSAHGDPVEGKLRIWHDDDRLMVEVRPLAARSPTHEALLRYIASLLEPDTENKGSPMERPPEPNGDPAAPDMLADLTEAEWLQAELLALQKEARARADSLDATLAYVRERCAAVMQD